MTILFHFSIYAYAIVHYSNFHFSTFNFQFSIFNFQDKRPCASTRDSSYDKLLILQNPKKLLSVVCCPLTFKSTFNFQFSTFNFQFYFTHFPSSTFNFPFSIFNFQMYVPEFHLEVSTLVTSSVIIC